MPSEQQPAQPVKTLEALLKLYAKGHRNFSGSDLRGVTVNIIDESIKHLDLREIILSGSNLTAIVLNKSYLKVDLTGADLTSCNLQGANLSSCRLERCNFSNSDLRRVYLNNSSCRGSDFIQAVIQIYTTELTDFTAANFTGANLSPSYLSGKFSYANFSNSNLQNSTLKYFECERADFSGADLQGLILPAYTTVNIRSCYYNDKTKISEHFDPIANGWELLNNEDNEGDSEDLGCAEKN